MDGLVRPDGSFHARDVLLVGAVVVAVVHFLLLLLLFLLFLVFFFASSLPLLFVGFFVVRCDRWRNHRRNLGVVVTE